ncbi:MAG: hypothetical protein AAF960_28235 [Bacteroidota bacterium]
MLCKNFLLLLLQFGACAILAQPIPDGIQTQLNSSATNLVSDVFIKGTCKNVRNITRSGESESFGVFENGADIIGFSEGIIITRCYTQIPKICFPSISISFE